MSQVDAKELTLIEKQILAQTERIEKAEDRIEAEEKNIKDSQRIVLRLIRKNPVPVLIKHGKIYGYLDFMRQFIVQKIARHRLSFTLLVVTGIVLVWRGIWEITAQMPILEYSLAALLLGILILWLVERYTDLL